MLFLFSKLIMVNKVNVFNVPVNYDFLESLHKFITDKYSNILELSKITILLPSRRSCNELKRVFLEKSKNQAIILPNIKAIGDIDYDDLILKQVNCNDLKNIVNISANTSRIKYKILLLKELTNWMKQVKNTVFSNINMEQIVNLSLELNSFFDEVSKNNLSLDNLKDIVDDDYSQHWQEILKFLQIFGSKWNNFLKENNIISANDYKFKMINMNTEYFKSNKPLYPIIIAGVSGSAKNTAELIKELLKYDNCYMIFKGLDIIEDKDSNINVLHPQYMFKNLLNNYLKIDRNKIKLLEYNEFKISNDGINKVIRYSMIDYNRTSIWVDDLNIDKDSINHISKIECDNSTEELNIISYIVKNMYEENNSSISIITTNESFAKQLEIILKNMNVIVNNSFGNKFSNTNIVKFLFSILKVCENDCETLSLLSLLKNELTFFNCKNKEKINNYINILENKILRGAGKLSSVDLLKKAKEIGDNDFVNFIEEIINTIKSFNVDNKTFNDILKMHLEIAEKINGNNGLWNNQDYGVPLFNFFTEMINETLDYGTVKNLDEYFNILHYLIAENSYSDKYVVHPTVNIILPQEARLINYDLVILSNMNEGSFPKYTESDPWMSKNMRINFGLPDKNEIIGEMAYDFTQYLGNKKVIITRSIKEDNKPSVKSRFLLRLETFLSCQNNLVIQEENIWKNVYKKYTSIKQNEIRKLERPNPIIPLDKRLKKLSATHIEKIMKNPYDMYAEKILQLKEKRDFYEDDKNVIFFGNAVHEAIDTYIRNYHEFNKEKLSSDNLYNKLIKYGKDSFNKHFVNEIMKNIYFIRFENIAKFFVEEDEKRRNDNCNILSEEQISLDNFNNKNFKIFAKVDRIEKDQNGRFTIIDYKTGVAPSRSEVKYGKKPQLVIEAIILNDANIVNKKINNLEYWNIKGRDGKNTIIQIEKNSDYDLIENIMNSGIKTLNHIIDYFSNPENGYICTLYELSNTSYPSLYKHLSRIEEWGTL